MITIILVIIVVAVIYGAIVDGGSKITKSMTMEEIREKNKKRADTIVGIAFLFFLIIMIIGLIIG
jgi:hypothetical protein